MFNKKITKTTKVVNITTSSEYHAALKSEVLYRLTQIEDKIADIEQELVEALNKVNNDPEGIE